MQKENSLPNRFIPPYHQFNERQKNNTPISEIIHLNKLFCDGDGCFYSHRPLWLIKTWISIPLGDGNWLHSYLIASNNPYRRSPRISILQTPSWFPWCSEILCIWPIWANETRVRVLLCATFPLHNELVNQKMDFGTTLLSLGMCRPLNACRILLEFSWHQVFSSVYLHCREWSGRYDQLKVSVSYTFFT